MLDVDPLAITSFGDVALRLGLATGLGLLLGLDREIAGADAGIRTHALVSLSSAMIMMSSLLLYASLRETSHAPDPLRALEGLAQAIGFIAAGLIFVRGNSVRNMTSAANIWIAAAIGIACGAGQYVLVLTGSALALLLVVAVRLVERSFGSKTKTNDD